MKKKRSQLLEHNVFFFICGVFKWMRNKCAGCLFCNNWDINLYKLCVCTLIIKTETTLKTEFQIIGYWPLLNEFTHSGCAHLRVCCTPLTHAHTHTLNVKLWSIVRQKWDTHSVLCRTWIQRMIWQDQSLFIKL